MGSTYDPLGLIVPIRVPAKRLFQTLWDKQHSWDAQLSLSDEAGWIRTREDHSASG